jgi:hypothetical protein
MGQLLRNNPTPDALARALNEVAAAMAAAAPRAGGRPGSPR